MTASTATACGPTTAPAPTFVLPAQNGERMDRRVGLELDVGLDPRGLRVDDRDAREHVRLVDAVAKRCGRIGELGARVHALGLGGIGGDVGGDTLAILNEMAHGVGQVQLALRVRRVDPVERGPDPVGGEDVDRRVDLVHGELLRRRVTGLDDLPNGALVVADDAAVLAWVGGPEGEDRGGCVLAAVRLEEVAQEPGAERRRVSAEDEQVAVDPVERRARRGQCVTGSPWLGLDGDLDPVERASPSGEVTTTSGSASTARAASTTQSTIRRPSNGWKCFGVAERMRVPRPAASTTAAGFGRLIPRSLLGRQDSNLGSRDQNPLPYRLATPQRDLSLPRDPSGNGRAGKRPHASLSALSARLRKQEHERDDGEERDDDQRERTRGRTRRPARARREPGRPPRSRRPAPTMSELEPVAQREVEDDDGDCDDERDRPRRSHGRRSGALR